MPITNMTLQISLGSFDLLAEPEGVDDFEGLRGRAGVMTIDGRPTRVAALDDLIAKKNGCESAQGSTASDGANRAKAAQVA